MYYMLIMMYVYLCYLLDLEFGHVMILFLFLGFQQVIALWIFTTLTQH